MIAYKGFTEDLCSVMGDGKEENCKFQLNETKTVDESKTGRNGFHCCENPTGCLAYYPMNGKNRFFKVEAAGDINEDAGGRIACTTITLLQELAPMDFAAEAMRYIINHPDRSEWESSCGGVSVQKDEANAEGKDYIAIARGADPVVTGAEGSVAGFLQEKNGQIVQCKLIRVSSELAGKRLHIGKDRKVVEEG
ncbi:MAG: hypothetical protein MSA09_03455 [Lachnospiraceae bacterium]|nr:hypothetical protein [Lachnospiraceae bacterium]